RQQTSQLDLCNWLAGSPFGPFRCWIGNQVLDHFFGEDDIAPVRIEYSLEDGESFHRCRTNIGSTFKIDGGLSRLVTPIESTEIGNCERDFPIVFAPVAELIRHRWLGVTQ